MGIIQYPASGSRKHQIFTVSGTWYNPGVKYCYVTVIGAGGGAANAYGHGLGGGASLVYTDDTITDTFFAIAAAGGGGGGDQIGIPTPGAGAGGAEAMGCGCGGGGGHGGGVLTTGAAAGGTVAYCAVYAGGIEGGGGPANNGGNYGTGDHTNNDSNLFTIGEGITYGCGGNATTSNVGSGTTSFVNNKRFKLLRTYGVGGKAIYPVVNDGAVGGDGGYVRRYMLLDPTPTLLITIGVGGGYSVDGFFGSDGWAMIEWDT